MNVYQFFGLAVALFSCILCPIVAWVLGYGVLTIGLAVPIGFVLGFLAGGLLAHIYMRFIPNGVPAKPQRSQHDVPATLSSTMAMLHCAFGPEYQFSENEISALVEIFGDEGMSNRNIACVVALLNGRAAEDYVDYLQVSRGRAKTHRLGLPSNNPYLRGSNLAGMSSGRTMTEALGTGGTRQAKDSRSGYFQ